MSFEANRRDFEKALGEAEDSIEAMESCVDDHILAPIKAMVNEYTGHYSDDIDTLINEKELLQERLDELTGE